MKTDGQHSFFSIQVLLLNRKSNVSLQGASSSISLNFAAPGASRRLPTSVRSVLPSLLSLHCSPLCVYRYGDPIPLPPSLPLLSAAPLQLHQSRVRSHTHAHTHTPPRTPSHSPPRAAADRQRVLCDRRRSSASVSPVAPASPAAPTSLLIHEAQADPAWTRAD